LLQVEDKQNPNPGLVLLEKPSLSKKQQKVKEEGKNGSNLAQLGNFPIFVSRPHHFPVK